MVVRRATALLLALVACNSIAASFDCTKASNFAEKEICRDGYLSGLDTSLSQNYKAALLKVLTGRMFLSSPNVSGLQLETNALHRNASTKQCSLVSRQLKTLRAMK